MSPRRRSGVNNSFLLKSDQGIVVAVVVGLCVRIVTRFFFVLHYLTTLIGFLLAGVSVLHRCCADVAEGVNREIMKDKYRERALIISHSLRNFCIKWKFTEEENTRPDKGHSDRSSNDSTDEETTTARVEIVLGKRKNNCSRWYSAAAMAF